MSALPHVDALGKRLGVEWTNLTGAAVAAEQKKAELVRALTGYDSLDLSVVVFGSLARRELTPESDPDWTLLVDGAADPNHLETARQIRAKIESLFKRGPGREGIFGNLSFSHELVHQIGGEDDSNSNTTRRILLLLESDVIGREAAYERVVNSVLRRYVLEDATFAKRNTRHHVPRFLLNDFARYWRTMAVDFAYKARTRGGSGYGLRNFKLRMSRKLIYVAGLLTCLSCDMGLARAGGPAGCAIAGSECVDCLRTFMRRPPLEIVAQFLQQFGEKADVYARQMLGAYDQFIGILADEARRKALDALGPDDLESDAFKDPRDISHDFRDGVLGLFFNADEKLANLTRIYGVF